ncbi:MAG: hypothetical protein KAW40_02885 [Candidatus Aenigmarchaeota archaeon]|nr:hypothetical protein [Candidatus Aenigmarchaeota archaeon]
MPESNDLKKFIKDMQMDRVSAFINSGTVVACNYECEKDPGYTGCGHRSVCPSPDYMRRLHTERENNPHVAGTGPSERAKNIKVHGIH